MIRERRAHSAVAVSNQAAHPAQARRLSESPCVQWRQWRVTELVFTQNIGPSGAHPSPTQGQPVAQTHVLPQRAGRAHLMGRQAWPCALSPLVVSEADRAAVSLVPEEEAVVLPGDKSLQSLPFSWEGKGLLSEPPCRAAHAPLIFQCGTVGFLPIILGLRLWYILSADQSAELCSITDETNRMKVTDPKTWVLLHLDPTITQEALTLRRR